MEDFSITTRVNSKEYAKIVFVGLYQKPAFIFATLLGIYFVMKLVLRYFGVVKSYTDISSFDIFCGFFLLLAPTLIVLIAVRQFASNTSCNKDITFVFTETGIRVQGLTYKGEFLWAHFIKYKESGKFLILYQSKRAGYFVDKTKLLLAQLEFIETKVGKR